MLSQFPSLPSGQVTLNNDSVKVDDSKSLMEKVTGAVTTVLFR